MIGFETKRSGGNREGLKKRRSAWSKSTLWWTQREASSKQQAAAMQEFVQSQFGVNLNDLLSSSKWSSTSNTSRFWIPKLTLFGVLPKLFPTADAIIQQYAPFFYALTNTSGVVRSIGVTSLLILSPDRVAPYGLNITDMDYL